MKQPAIMLFDLDDTLYPERDFLHSGWRAVAEASGIDPHEAYALMSSADNAFDALHERLPEFSIAEMLAVYRSHFPSITLSPGVEEALKGLRSLCEGIGIITDGRSVTQRNKINALGLEKYVDYISVSEEIGADKNSPEPFLRAMRHFGEDNLFIYAGDNIVKDFLWPNRLGWLTIMVEEPEYGRNIHNQHIKPATPEHMPNEIVGDIRNIVHKWM